LWRDVVTLLLLLGLGKAGVNYEADADAMAGILLPEVGCFGGKLPFQLHCFPSRSSPVHVGEDLCVR